MRSLMIEEFTPGHIDRLEAQGTDTGWLWPATPAQLAAGPGFAVIARAGQKVVCCCGLIIPWPGRAMVWAILDQEARRHMVALHRWASHILDTVPMRRMELILAADDVEPVFRWVRMLGFSCEAHMESFYSASRDGWLYVKIQRELS
jgi:hypothetical protein